MKIYLASPTTLSSVVKRLLYSFYDLEMTQMQFRNKTWNEIIHENLYSKHRARDRTSNHALYKSKKKTI